MDRKEWNKSGEKPENTWTENVYMYRKLDWMELGPLTYGY